MMKRFIPILSTVFLIIISIIVIFISIDNNKPKLNLQYDKKELLLLPLEEYTKSNTPIPTIDLNFTYMRYDFNKDYGDLILGVTKDNEPAPEVSITGNNLKVPETPALYTITIIYYDGDIPYHFSFNVNKKAA